MTDFVTKDSGERQNFNSGARRDISHGKTRPDLISAKARQRWGDLMGRGAEKYGARNWELGMPASRFLESAYRHLLNYELGDRDEDHLAAVLFNIGAMIHFEGTEWDDINGEDEDDEVYVLTEKSRAFLEKWEQLDSDNENLMDWHKSIGKSIGTQQLELPFYDVDLYQDADAIPTFDLINWDGLKRQVEAGQIDGSTVRWPNGYQAPQA